MNKHMSFAAGVVALALVSTPAAAQETVIMGSVGSSSANGWPSYVAIEKGFFAAAGIKPDIVLRAVQRLGDPAARGGLDQFLHQLRPGRSDPRHREGRAARDHPHRGADAALFAAGQVRTSRA